MPRILVVDDDPAIRVMLTDALGVEGWVVDSAEHGVAALAKVHQARPDVILLDLMMPVMDGWETVERLRHEGYDDIPVIVLTAAPMLSRIQRQFPHSPVIGKPFDLPHLVAAVQEALEARRQPPHR
ncbi:MAG TPA: response regulator [Dehalococcoidia bacterium]